jgi:hypothetical protein
MEILVDNSSILAVEKTFEHSYHNEKRENIKFSSNAQFINANTLEVTHEHLQKDCIIPVWSKDNESTISHVEFIETAYEVMEHIFVGEQINYPAVRVSHPVRGRIPSAMGKPAIELEENDKTCYYERMAFLIEVPNLKFKIGDNELALTVGGVRAYNHENLFNKKSEEKFKVFIGFKNKVCTNLCISTDGLKTELKAMTTQELGSGIFDLIKSFKAERFMDDLKKMPNTMISEHQFAQVIGRMRMYGIMPQTMKKGIPNLLLTDNMINSVVKNYYLDENFSRNLDGSISMWNFYNLLTESNKSSYIDTFLDRSANSLAIAQHLTNSIYHNLNSWYLN